MHLNHLVFQGRVRQSRGLGHVGCFAGGDVFPAQAHAELRHGGDVMNEPLHLPRRWIYLAMNKPSGYVTTHADPQHRQTVDELLGSWRGKVFAIGRLDRDTEGLLLFTNNGDLANRLLHPRYQRERTYLAWVRPHPTLEMVRRIEAGIVIGPGEKSGPSRVRVLGRKGDTARVRITLREGKYREVRRIFAAVKIKVLALRRISFAGLDLGGMPAGSVRALAPDELDALARLTGCNLTAGVTDVRTRRSAPPHR